MLEKRGSGNKWRFAVYKRSWSFVGLVVQGLGDWQAQPAQWTQVPKEEGLLPEAEQSKGRSWEMSRAWKFFIHSLCGVHINLMLYSMHSIKRRKPGKLGFPTRILVAFPKRHPWKQLRPKKKPTPSARAKTTRDSQKHFGQRMEGWGWTFGYKMVSLTNPERSCKFRKMGHNSPQKKKLIRQQLDHEEKLFWQEGSRQWWCVWNLRLHALQVCDSMYIYIYIHWHIITSSFPEFCRLWRRQDALLTPSPVGFETVPGPGVKTGNAAVLGLA